MGLKSFLAKPFAARTVRKIRRWSADPVATQRKQLAHLMAGAIETAFGKDHGFAQISDLGDLKAAIPLRDYEALRPYVDRMVAGEPDVLWKGRPLYYAKTSGTTSGLKYIPISRESIPNHLRGAREALLCYIHRSGNAKFVEKKLIFLSGSPTLTKTKDVLTGRLSGIVNHHIPSYFKRSQLPSYQTNCIEDWETKLDSIIDETIDQPMSLISGIPPWVQMYFDRIIERTGKPVGEVFSHFSLFVYGGVNFEPYKEKLFASIGRSVDRVETYPASEGFIAYQDGEPEEGLLLLLDHGMVYEFVPLDESHLDNPTRLTIGEVELGVNYEIILHTNAGLWGYRIGDVVQFTSTKPCRIKVTGRTKHFISAFGEHVIGQEVEKAMAAACEQYPEVQVVEFTVAPFVQPGEGQSCHEWFVEFATPPSNPTAFAAALDKALCGFNAYYDDLIRGNILQPLQLRPLKPDGFIDYMRAQGKLGGQNKVPRLANDRKLADGLTPYLLT